MCNKLHVGVAQAVRMLDGCLTAKAQQLLAIQRYLWKTCTPEIGYMQFTHCWCAWSDCWSAISLACQKIHNLGHCPALHLRQQLGGSTGGSKVGASTGSLNGGDQDGAVARGPDLLDLPQSRILWPATHRPQSLSAPTHA